MNLDRQVLPCHSSGSVGLGLHSPAPRNSRWTANGAPCALDSGWTFLLSSEELRLQDCSKSCSEVHSIYLGN